MTQKHAPWLFICNLIYKLIIYKQRVPSSVPLQLTEEAPLLVFQSLLRSLLRTLINTLLLHIPLLTLTDRQNDRQRNKYTCCAWAGGTFFQLCCCVSFWFWREIGFCFTYLCTQSTIQLWCCVSFLVLAGNSFWCYVHSQCTIQLCGCVSFFGWAGNSSQNENTFLQQILIGLLYYDPLADVCIS